MEYTGAHVSEQMDFFFNFFGYICVISVPFLLFLFWALYLLIPHVFHTSVRFSYIYNLVGWVSLIYITCHIPKFFCTVGSLGKVG